MATTRTRPTLDAASAWVHEIDDAKVWVALGVAMAASTAVVLWFGRTAYFTADEVSIFSSTLGFDLGEGIDPYNGHLVLIPKLLYALVLNVFGPEYAIFRALTVTALVVTAGLFFVFAKRRIGALAALAPTLVLLFSGSDSGHVLYGNGFGVMFPAAAGIGAFLSLDREDLAGDLVACALLVAAIACYSDGIPFVAGAAILVLLGADRWRRAWVFLVPILLYGAWQLWSTGDEGSTESTVRLANILLAPNWSAESLASVGAAFVGLNYPFSEGGAGWGPVIAVLLVAGLGWSVWHKGVTRWLLAAMAVAGTLWVMGAAAALPPVRVPDSPRYLFPATIAVLLVAVEAARGLRPGPRLLLAIYAIVAISLATNIALLRDGSSHARGGAAATRADLAGVEIAGGRVSSDLPLFLGAVLRATGENDVADDYIAAVREFGHLGYTLEELRAQPEPVREDVDKDLANSLPVRLQAETVGGKRCRPAPAEAGGGASFEVPPGGAVLESPTEPVSLRLRRFGLAFTVVAGELEPGEPMLLSIPRDSAPDPWYATASGPGLQVCTERAQ